MIWLWITLSLILSFIPLINKKIDIAYYVWLLLPIDAYGIVIANTTIKPYMIFALIVPIVLYTRYKGSDFDLSAGKSQLLAGIVAILIIIVNLFNDNSFASVKAAFMTLVVYVCAQLCISCSENKNSDQLADVLIASCFGCSVVFIIIFLCLQNGLTLDGFVASHRTNVGIFMRTVDMKNGNLIETFRLRGFAYDPTIMFPQFIFGIVACISKLFKKFKLYYLITLILSVFSVILSRSRMGLLCVALSIIITCTIEIVQFETVRKKVLCVVTGLTCCVTLLCFSLTKFGQSAIGSVLSSYSGRSGLNDKYGRFSIWRDCFSAYWNENPLWGVGMGNIKNYSAIGRTPHNTWLQFICECGLIVGGIAIIYFLSIMIMSWFKGKNYISSDSNTSYVCLTIGYTVTIVALTSADSITFSYLWFGALLLLKMMSYQPDSNSLKTDEVTIT